MFLIASFANLSADYGLRWSRRERCSTCSGSDEDGGLAELKDGAIPSREELPNVQYLLSTA